MHTLQVIMLCTANLDTLQGVDPEKVSRMSNWIMQHCFSQYLSQRRFNVQTMLWIL